MSPPDARRAPARALVQDRHHQAAGSPAAYPSSRSRVPSGSRFDDDHQLRRRLYVRRLLTEAAAVIQAGLDADEPLGPLAWHASDLTKAASSEALLAALGDER